MKNKHPKLWKLFKRMNRGLVLGLAVVLVMTVWLSASSAKVNKDIPALKELTKQYLIDLFEINAAMNGEEVGKKVSDSAVTEMRTSLEKLVAEYYSDSKAAQLAYKGSTAKINGTRLVDELSDWAKTARVFHVEKAEIVETEEATQSGYVVKNYYFYTTQKATKYLEVEYSFEILTTVVTDDPNNVYAYPFSSKGGYPEYYADDKYMGGEFGETSGGDICRADLTVTVSGRLIFVREDGEWKLACTRGTYAYVSRTSNVEIISKGGAKVNG